MRARTRRSAVWLIALIALFGIGAAAQPTAPHRPWFIDTEDAVTIAVPTRIRHEIDLEYNDNDAILGIVYDLNGDGTRDYIVQSAPSLCGNGGCPYEIYDGSTGKRIGEVFGNRVYVLAQKISAFPIIETLAHRSASSAAFATYRFNGKKYVATTHDFEGRALDSLVGKLNRIPQWKAALLPPEPFVDSGACPFEGCVYRDWIAIDEILAHTARRDGAPVAFTIKKAERVKALTGVVVTRKAGRVQFPEAVDVRHNSGTLHISPGETLFLLTNQGEGFMKVWFRGKIYDGADVTPFYDEACEVDPKRCKVVEFAQPKSVWWVKIRNRRGQTGWTNQPDKLDNKDALALFE